MKKSEIDKRRNELWDARAQINEELKVLDNTVPEEEFFRIGERFRHHQHGYEAVLIQSEANMVIMASLCGGNRYREPIRVGDVIRITAEEFDKIAGGAFERIK